MQKCVYKGQLVEVDMSSYGEKYDGYFAEALYQCDDNSGKSLITLFVIRKGSNGMPVVVIPIQQPQYITADRGDVRRKIAYLVKYMCTKNKFDTYLNDFADVLNGKAD